MAEPGFDPTLEPRRRGPSDLRRGGGFGGALLTLGLAVAFAGVIWWGVWGRKAGAVQAANLPASPTATETAASAGVGGGAAVVVAHPTRTPVVWPTLGVLRLTATGGPSPTATQTVTAVSTGGKPTAVSDVGTPTSAPTVAPTQTPRVIYRDSGGGSVATVVVYVTEPPDIYVTYIPAPSQTPQPTYTPLPTYTPFPTSEPPTITPTATCPAPELAEPLADAGYVLYLPVVVGGGGDALSCP